MERPTPPYKVPTKKEPSLKTLERYLFDGIAQATDGCTVEPDGWCEHEYVSWLIFKGYC